jgi:DNA modification methylase
VILLPKLRGEGWEIKVGDCCKELPLLSFSPRCIVADPPYNIGIDYGDGTKDDLLPYDDYVSWLETWIQLSSEALTEDGSLWVIVSDEFAAEHVLAIKRSGLTLRSWIKWYEAFGTNCTKKFNRCTRHILYAVKNPKQFVFHREAVSRPSDRQTKYNDLRANPLGKVLDDCWFDIPRLCGTHKERMPGFPTQLPLKLLSRIIACCTDEGDLVLDPFSGSGTTGAAARRLERTYLGIEKRLGYARASASRLRNLV